MLDKLEYNYILSYQKYRGEGIICKIIKVKFVKRLIKNCLIIDLLHLEILKMMSFYKSNRYSLIVIICCSLHNFILK